MKTRKAERRDITRIEEIYRAAKEYMVAEGNTTQWSRGYPSRETIEEDISNERLFVIECDGKVVAVFVFTLEEEPAYRKIEGAWNNEEKYAVIHRVASDGTVRGITKFIYTEALKCVPYIRVDTHEKNKTMRSALTRFGFKECGKVYYTRDGERTERLAYDYHL